MLLVLSLQSSILAVAKEKKNSRKIFEHGESPKYIRMPTVFAGQWKYLKVDIVLQSNENKVVKQ